MIPPQSFVDVRRCWPEVSPQVWPSCSTFQTATGLTTPSTYDYLAPSENVLGIAVVSRCWSKACCKRACRQHRLCTSGIGRGRLGNLPELHRNPHSHAQRDPSLVRAFRPESFGKGAAVHGRDASELVDHSPTNALRHGTDIDDCGGAGATRHLQLICKSMGARQ